MSYIKKKKLFSYLYTSKLHRHEHRKKLQHIVIVGGGFAGFLLAKRINPEKFRVTLVDRKNFHAFPPLFYQIASSGLELPPFVFLSGKSYVNYVTSVSIWEKLLQ